MPVNIGEAGLVRFATPVGARGDYAGSLQLLDAIFEQNQEAVVSLKDGSGVVFRLVAEKDSSAQGKYLLKVYRYDQDGKRYVQDDRSAREVLNQVFGPDKSPSCLFAVLRQLTTLDLKKGLVYLDLGFLVTQVRGETKGRRVTPQVLNRWVSQEKVGDYSQKQYASELQTLNSEFTTANVDKVFLVQQLNAKLAEVKRCKFSGTELKQQIADAETKIKGYETQVKNEKTAKDNAARAVQAQLEQERASRNKEGANARYALVSGAQFRYKYRHPGQLEKQLPYLKLEPGERLIKFSAPDATQNNPDYSYAIVKQDGADSDGPAKYVFVTDEDGKTAYKGYRLVADANGEPVVSTNTGYLTDMELDQPLPTELDPLKISPLRYYTKEEVAFLLQAGWQDDGDGIAQVHEFGDNEGYAKALDSGMGAHQADGVISGSLSGGENNIGENKTVIAAWANLAFKGDFQKAIDHYKSAPDLVASAYNNGSFHELAEYKQSAITLVNGRKLGSKEALDRYLANSFYSSGLKDHLKQQAALARYKIDAEDLASWVLLYVLQKAITYDKAGLDAVAADESRVADLQADIDSAEEYNRARTKAEGGGSDDTSAKYIQEALRRLRAKLSDQNTSLSPADRARQFFVEANNLMRGGLDGIDVLGLADEPEYTKLKQEAYLMARDYRRAMHLAASLDAQQATSRHEQTESKVGSVFKQMKEDGVYQQRLLLLADPMFEDGKKFNRDVYAKELIKDCLDSDDLRLRRLVPDALKYLPKGEFEPGEDGSDIQKRAWGQIKVSDFRALAVRRKAEPARVVRALRLAFKFNTKTSNTDGRTVGGWGLRDAEGLNQPEMLKAAEGKLAQIANDKTVKYSREEKIYANFARVRCWKAIGDLDADNNGQYDAYMKAAELLSATYKAFQLSGSAQPPVNIPYDHAVHYQKMMLYMFALMVGKLVPQYLTTQDGGRIPEALTSIQDKAAKNKAIALLAFTPVEPMQGKSGSGPVIPEEDPETGARVQGDVKPGSVGRFFRSAYSVTNIRPETPMKLSQESKSWLEGLYPSTKEPDGKARSKKARTTPSAGTKPPVSVPAAGTAAAPTAKAPAPVTAPAGADGARGQLLQRDAINQYLQLADKIRHKKSSLQIQFKHLEGPRKTAAETALEDLKRLADDAYLAANAISYNEEAAKTALSKLRQALKVQV